MTNEACCLDMIGLSNQALSEPACKALLEVFDARPTVMKSRSGFKANFLVEAPTSRGIKLTETVSGQQQILRDRSQGTWMSQYYIALCNSRSPYLANYGEPWLQNCRAEE